jgi:hypothetical protein
MKHASATDTLQYNLYTTALTTVFGDSRRVGTSNSTGSGDTITVYRSLPDSSRCGSGAWRYRHRLRDVLSTDTGSMFHASAQDPVSLALSGLLFVAPLMAAGVHVAPVRVELGPAHGSADGPQ